MNPDDPNATQQLENLQEAARVLGLELEPVKAKSPSDLEAAIVAIAGRSIGAMLVGPDPQFGGHAIGVRCARFYSG